METLQRGAGVIRRAESELRELLARAADQGEYDCLVVLVEWAKKLGMLIHDVAGVSGSPPPQAVEPGVDTDKSFTPPFRNSRSGSPANLNGTARKRKSSGRKAVGKKRKRQPVVSRDYPKFLREGEDLVKVGWSKRDKAPYEHKAPRRVLSLLVEAVSRVGKSGQRFTMEQVLPLHDLQDGADVPSYQVYLVLAWLRVEDLIVQHGRQGYSLPEGSDLAAESAERWQKLSRR